MKPTAPNYSNMMFPDSISGDLEALTPVGEDVLPAPPALAPRASPSETTVGSVSAVLPVTASATTATEPATTDEDAAAALADLGVPEKKWALASPERRRQVLHGIESLQILKAAIKDALTANDPRLAESAAAMLDRVHKIAAAKSPKSYRSFARKHKRLQAALACVALIEPMLLGIKRKIDRWTDCVEFKIFDVGNWATIRLGRINKLLVKQLALTDQEPARYADISRLENESARLVARDVVARLFPDVPEDALFKGELRRRQRKPAGKQRQLRKRFA